MCITGYCLSGRGQANCTALNRWKYFSWLQASKAMSRRSCGQHVRVSACTHSEFHRVKRLIGQVIQRRPGSGSRISTETARMCRRYVESCRELEHGQKSAWLRRGVCKRSYNWTGRPLPSYTWPACCAGLGLRQTILPGHVPEHHQAKSHDMMDARLVSYVPFGLR